MFTRSWIEKTIIIVYNLIQISFRPGMVLNSVDLQSDAKYMLSS